jgi:hypothetical protein
MMYGNDNGLSAWGWFAMSVGMVVFLTPVIGTGVLLFP